MASGSPEHHVGRLGHRLGSRSNNSVVAAQERIEALISRAGVSLGRQPDPLDEASTFLGRWYRLRLHVNYRVISFAARPATYQKTIRVPIRQMTTWPSDAAVATANPPEFTFSPLPAGR